MKNLIIRNNFINVSRKAAILGLILGLLVILPIFFVKTTEASIFDYFPNPSDYYDYDYYDYYDDYGYDYDYDYDYDYYDYDYCGYDCDYDYDYDYYDYDYYDYDYCGYDCDYDYDYYDYNYYDLCNDGCDYDEPQVQTLTGSCSVSPSRVEVGDYLNWSASASGGSGSYSYAWSGTDALTGTGRSISKNYSSAGTKTGTVTITSGSQHVTKTCTATVVAPQVETLTGSCSVSPSSVNIGGYLNWSASASGGAGSYTYSWSGTDSLSGNGSSISKTYSTAGTKTGTVTITSGDQSISRTCSAVVNQVIEDNLSVSCSPSQSTADVDENIIWRAYPTGGDGSYRYDWSGTDSLDGSSRNLTWSYDDSGTKRATVTVESRGQSATASCTVRVNDDEEESDDLSVSCYANPTSAQVGSRVRWYVEVDGGDGDYDYDWSGSEDLDSSSRSPYMTYDSAGRKTAMVTVRDGDGNRDSDTCYVNINSVLAFTQTYQAPIAPAVYLSQVPYTGLADDYKLYFFIGILALFSAWIAYIVISYKKNSEVKM